MSVGAEYAAMQTFQPSLHADAVPIEIVLGQRGTVTIDVSQRSCSMCPYKPPDKRPEEDQDPG